MAGPDLPQAIERARTLFLDDPANTHGCAEVTMIALQEALGLPEAADSTAAMALNGGIAYSGGVCGAVSGAALAAGRLAGREIADHVEAKRAARGLIQALMAEFGAEFGATDCRTLTGYDLLAPGGHDAFMAANEWRDACTRQIEFAIEATLRLVAEAPWAGASLGGAPSTPAGS